VRSWQAAYQGLLPQAYLDGLDPAERIVRILVADAGWPTERSSRMTASVLP
jgi:hypothetical protein